MELLSKYEFSILFNAFRKAIYLIEKDRPYVYKCSMTTIDKLYLDMLSDEELGIIGKSPERIWVNKVSSNWKKIEEYYLNHGIIKEHFDGCYVLFIVKPKNTIVDRSFIYE